MVPPTALGAVHSVVNDDISSLAVPSDIEETPLRGKLVGIARPIWKKVVESECRLAWLHDMVKCELVVRDINAYSQSISECLRSDEIINKEEENKLLMGLMRIKLKDEKKHLDNLKRGRERGLESGSKR